VLAKHGGKIIPNLFADQVPTKPHWGRVMTILPFSKGTPDEYVLGVRPAALPEILRHNGYETHFSYASGYFGNKKGPLLTTYAFHSAYSTCKFLHGNAKTYALLGYCGLHRAGWLGPATKGAEAKDRFFMNRLRIATRADESKPQLFASHYPRPNHTPKSYKGTKEDLDDYRKAYQARSVMAARIMDRMLTKIRSADPTAIVLVFGDHGPFTKRGVRYDDDPESVQDHHGILGAVFGADECMPFMLPKAGTRTQTFAQVEVGLLQCLSGGSSPLRQDFDFGKIFQAPGLTAP
jgi:arylsulfatase A-like enzyme